MNEATATKILDQIAPTVARVGIGSLREDGAFLCILKAALVKQYEFSQLVLETDKSEFHFSICSFLRGLCEDIIWLKYLNNAPSEDRNRAIRYITDESIRTHVEKQSNFFSHHRPSQCVLRIREGAQSGEQETIKQEFDLLKSVYCFRGNKWPKVKEMAEKTKLLALYNYLYAVTSSTVHFSPRILGRMGWGDGRSHAFKFSTGHFSEYYCSFYRFYSLYLLATFCTSFSASLECRQDLECHIEELIRLIESENRWPESVTPEEMNYFQNPFKSLFSPYVVASDIGMVHSIAPHWEWA
jgi:hypothetical protein